VPDAVLCAYLPCVPTCAHLPCASTCRVRLLAPTCCLMCLPAVCAYLRPLAVCTFLFLLAVLCAYLPCAPTCAHLPCAPTCAYLLSYAPTCCVRLLAPTCRLMRLHLPSGLQTSCECQHIVMHPCSCRVPDQSDVGHRASDQRDDPAFIFSQSKHRASYAQRTGEPRPRCTHPCLFTCHQRCVFIGRYG